MQPETKPVALMLGGNVGNTLELFREAILLLSERAGKVTAKSQVYISAPWGMEQQPWFKNQALLLNTALSPMELLKSAHEIETILGRSKGERNGPRSIDIDLLLYNNLIISEPGLIIPHPRMHLRKFNLEPLSEIAGNWIHPLLGRTIAELNAGCTDPLIVQPMSPDAAE